MEGKLSTLETQTDLRITKLDFTQSETTQRLVLKIVEVSTCMYCSNA